MAYSKRTKIVATIGPASSDVRVLRTMIRAGLNVARINCAHGDHAEWRKRIQAVREANRAEKGNVAILLDLSGPKIRTGDFSAEMVTLKRGHAFTLTTKRVIGDSTHACVNYPRLPQEVAKGMRIMLDDGKLMLRVKRVRATSIETEIEIGGVIRGRRGVNIPDAKLSISTITAKDKRDIAFGVKEGVDFFALSFVRHENDVRVLRKLLNARRSSAHIVAKIETRSALARLDAIIPVSDSVMVARGDLAVEIPKEEVPIAQKRIIRAAGKAGRTVITATQMLDSMTTSSSPTRAEIGDVANAIFDGTDAVMLSQESAVGVDPAHVVKTMASIAEYTEQSPLYKETVAHFDEVNGTVDTVSSAVVKSAASANAVAVVAFTESGFTPGMVARHKPGVPILSLTPIASTHRKLSLTYGVISRIAPSVRDITAALASARKELLRSKIASRGDTFILVFGIPFGHSGGTNTMIIQTV